MSIQMGDAYDYLLKFLIIGASGAGKSCILRRFLEGRFEEGLSHTVGVEFGSKVIQLGPHRVKLQIWDTAGQERFHSVTRSYYRGAGGALLVYDLTSRESFASVSRWLREARQLATSDIVIVLVGNKLDLAESDRQVSLSEAESFARSNGIHLLEVSAKSPTSQPRIDEAFHWPARTILGKVESGELDPSIPNSGVQRGSAAARGANSLRFAGGGIYGHSQGRCC